MALVMLKKKTISIIFLISQIFLELSECFICHKKNVWQSLPSCSYKANFTLLAHFLADLIYLTIALRADHNVPTFWANWSIGDKENVFGATRWYIWLSREELSMTSREAETNVYSMWYCIPSSMRLSKYTIDCVNFIICFPASYQLIKQQAPEVTLHHRILIDNW